MSDALSKLFEQLLVAYCRGRELILLFDYDGTLVPIVKHPRLAILPNETRRILEHLVELPRVNLGILSGRQLADLKEMIGISKIYLAGTSGLELDFAGIQIRHPAAGGTIPHLKFLDEFLTAVLRDFSGAWLETKPVGLTIHFRDVRADSANILRNRLARLVAAFAGRIKVLESSLSLEITPNLGWNKGSAVSMFVDSIRAADPLVLYVGDSANDAEAMTSTAALGGMTVGVGLEAPASAQVSVAKTDEVCDFIDALTCALAGNQRSVRATSTSDI